MNKILDYSKGFLAAALLTVTCAHGVRAENNFLKLGIAEFNAGNYSDASGHFGAALATEFNNSVLHYYLGNCYVHMKQRDAAIREFRIAYALDPDKDVGKYAKQALAGLNADSPDGATAKANTPTTAPTVGDAQAKAAVDKLLDLKSKQDPSKTQPSLTKIEIGRGGRIEPVTVSLPTPSTTTNDAAKQLELLRKLYEGGRYVPTSKMNQEIQKTAENLQQLMRQEAKPGTHHLVPAGTNLYIRNYQTAPPEGAQTPLPTPAQPNPAQPSNKL